MSSRPRPSARSSPTTLPASPPRRTQEERSQQTRGKLCRAAIELLNAVGYGQVTTAQIAQHAGVSKGALAHHFRSKADLMAAALEHLIRSWRPQRDAFRKAHGRNTSMEQLLTFLWREIFGSPNYIAFLELLQAGRHDAALYERQRQWLNDWSVERDDMYRRLLSNHAPDHEFHTFLQLNFCVLRGMAIYKGLDTDERLNERVLKLWIATASRMVEAMRDPSP